LPAQIPKHCPSAEPSLAVRTAQPVRLPTKAVAYEQIPTRLSGRGSTALVVVFTQCNGILAGSPSFSSLVDQYQRISMLRFLSRPIGVLLCPDGPRSIVIHSSSFMTMSQSLIPPSVATGLPAYGHRLGYPAKNKAVLLELVSLHVKTLFAITGRPSKKLTGKSNRTSDTRRTRHDIHAPVAFSHSSHHRRYFLSPNAYSLSHHHRSSQRRHEVQIAVFISPYPLLRCPYHYRALSLSRSS